MVFSELSLAEKDSGLTFDQKRLSLIGTKNGFGTVVTDTDDEYTVKIFAKEPFHHEKAIATGIISLSESLSKNTINSQKCEFGFVEVKLNKGCLLQEKLVLLIDFLDKLTTLMKDIGIVGAEAVLPPESQKEVKENIPKDSKKIRLGFDFNSIKGLIGALIACVVSVLIATMSVKISPDNPTNLTGNISAYVISAVTTALIFFDYRFLAKKIDAFGVIICPVLALITAILSSVAIAVKSISEISNIPLNEAIAKLGSLYDFNPDIASFVESHLISSILISAFASIIVCVFYFNRHPDEMYNSEIIVKKDQNNNKK